jgi:hypothetical protein
VVSTVAKLWKLNDPIQGYSFRPVQSKHSESNPAFKRVQTLYIFGIYTTPRKLCILYWYVPFCCLYTPIFNRLTQHLLKIHYHLHVSVMLIHPQAKYYYIRSRFARILREKLYNTILHSCIQVEGRSQWPRGVTRGSAAARLLGSNPAGGLDVCLL